MRVTQISIILVFLLLAVQGSVNASSADFGTPVKGEIVSVKQDPKPNSWTLRVKLLESCVGPGMKLNKAGTVVVINELKKTVPYVKGQKVKVRWMSYSAMTPNGPISGTSWEFVP